MLDIDNLEKRWSRYNVKKKIPYIIGSSLLLVTGISIGSYFIFYPQTSKIQVTNSNKIDNSVNNTSKKEIVPLVVQKAIDKEAIEDEKVVLRPSLSFATRINEYKSAPLYIPSLPPKEIPVLQAPKEVVRTVVPVKKVLPVKQVIQEEIIVEEVIQEVSHKGSLKVSKRDNEKDLQDVINRFKKNKNPKLSLHIAKKYYSLKRYNKSYNYALITNQIDENIEDSWIIFAQSLYKLGEKKMAMKTLNSYIKSSESIKASILLNDMRKGDFK